MCIYIYKQPVMLREAENGEELHTHTRSALQGRNT